METKKLLIITSSAGGGLLQAAVAQEQAALAHNPKIQTIQCDVLKDWVWSWLGRFSIESWNTAQKRGDVFSQKFFASFHRFFDYITWPNSFFHTLSILFKEDIDRVIDTQPSSTSAIMKAIRIFNWRRSKKVVLEKVIVDLPTRKATHFFRPIKALSKCDKKFLRLRTIEPLLEDGQTAEDFWQHFCGLSESEIHYEDVNVRLPFKNLQGKPRILDTVSIGFNAKNEDEIDLMRKSYQRGNISASVKNHEVIFDIPNEARVITILLGSQPASAATLNYVKNFVEVAKKVTKPIYLFVFCANHHGNSLFQKVSQSVQEIPDYPESLTIIPFSFQNDQVIAPLFHRSDITISRSGGGTAMELMAVSTGEIWIHSEAKSKTKNLTLRELLSGIPVWESESALYLYKLKGAKILTPEIFMPQAMRLLGN
ncbi:MAG TPA: glycosyltransferase [Chlamydiales bacterium]|nr:glycosyltransferase [Chlamydiales bacterium]